MATVATDRDENTVVWGVSPKNKSNMKQATDGPTEGSGSPLESRADPDAQTTVTDFLDFTEYLPSDIVRSLTLIGKLDQAYADASINVDELTTTWSQLPSFAPEERPAPAQVRADISEQLNRTLGSRVFAHDEAVRMSENVNRHYQKAQLLLAKLQTMMDNYPPEEQKSPTAPNSPQMVRTKLTVRPTGEDGQKIRQHRVPRITVPGEVLAPYDIEYDTVTDETDISSDDESDIPPTNRRTPAPAPRIKLLTNKSHKAANRPSRPPPYQSPAMTAAAAANAEALLHPPPPNAVIGSADAPWLQLTNYELAKLRKRMKKNATWTPSETMVARELKALARGPDEYRDAKHKAEEDGEDFDPKVPSLVVDDESGQQQLPAGAISVDSLAAEEVPTSNKGMKLNEAKKVKREALAQMAAEEAEESARKMARAAKLFLGEREESNNSKESGTPSGKPRTNSRSHAKRKRETEGDASANTVGESVDGDDTPSARPHAKRTKMETPAPQRLLTPGGTVVTTQSETPVPIPVPGKSQTSPTSNSLNAGTVTTSVPVKMPGSETPVPLPKNEQRKSVTPIVPPVRETPAREAKRETRGEAAKRTQPQNGTTTTTTTPQPSHQLTVEPPSRLSYSRGQTPGTTPGPEGGRRPSSRGKATSQEPGPGLATDRPRRSSTARNTPVPESKQQNKRTKRPAPGIVSTTNSGGNSAVGKRKAAPRKTARATKREKGQVTETEMEEVDDEGKPIDPDEARYCLCNRVSFGTMIQCDNVDNCKHEWFHLECVGLSDIPARTTKWYCPDCRKLLNLGEKGEVSARGVRK